MSAPHLAGLFDRPLPPSFTDLDPYDVGWVPPRLAVADEVARRIVKRMVQEDVLPALSARSIEEMWAEFCRAAPQYLRRAQAVSVVLSELPVDVEEDRRAFIEEAAEFGGEDWREALEDGWCSIQWADALVRRLDAATMEANDTERKALDAYRGLTVIWGWLLVAMATIVRQQASPIPEVRAFVVEGVRKAPLAAHALLREVARSRGPSQLPLDFEADELRAEDVALEREANTEGERLLREAGL